MDPKEPNLSDLIPLAKASYYKPEDEEQRRMFKIAAYRCLAGKFVSKADSAGLFISLQRLFFPFDIQTVYNACFLEPEPTKITQQVLEDLVRYHDAPVLKHDFLGPTMLGISIMLMGKNVGPEFIRRWSITHARTIFQIYDTEWKDEYSATFLTKPWARAIVALWDGSLEFRAMVFQGVPEGARCVGAMQRLFWHIELTLEYARLWGFHYVREFLVFDKAHPIIWDNYLRSDRAHLRDAIEVWKMFPETLRPYAGILATPQAFYKMCGEPLRRLIYIAVQVGRRTVASLREYTCAIPPDSTACDRLIEKYFPGKPVETLATPEMAARLDMPTDFPATLSHSSLLRMADPNETSLLSPIYRIPLKARAVEELPEKPVQIASAGPSKVQEVADIKALTREEPYAVLKDFGLKQVEREANQLD